MIDSAEFNEWVKPELYTEINNAIFRIVTSFRMLVANEKLPSDSTGGSSPQRTTYEDYPFEDDRLEFSTEDPNFDGWIKESIMLAVKSLIVFIKRTNH